MRKLKIAFVVGKMNGGGVETICMSYLKNLDKTRMEITFIVDSDSTALPKDEIKTLSGKLEIVPPYQKQIAYQKALYKLFKKNRYDIVHSHINTLSVFPLFAAWRAKVPVRVAHSHSTAGRGETKRNILKYILRPWSKVFATHLCSCGEYAGNWLFGKSSNYFIMPNNIDFDSNKYVFNAEKRAEKRTELNIENRIVIGHIGRFITQKNHTFLIEIFLKVLKIEPEAKLLLIGHGPLEELIKGKAKQLGIEDNIIFAGQREDVAELYQAMDIFLLPSIYEGVPLVAIEAQIAGLPVIMSDRVSTEATKFAELVHYVSLNKRPKEWAEFIVSVLEKSSVADRSLFSKYTERAGDNYVCANELSNWYSEIAQNVVGG